MSSKSAFPGVVGCFLACSISLKQDTLSLPQIAAQVEAHPDLMPVNVSMFATSNSNMAR